MTLDFILVPVGALCPAAACRGTVLRCTVVLIEGATSVAGEEARPPIPEVLIEASANIVVKAESVRVFAIRRPFPRLGDFPSFYRPRGEQFTGLPHYSSTWGGVASSAAELTTVLANLALVGASWRVLCPYRSDFEVVHRGWLSGRRPRAGSRVPSTRVHTRHSGERDDVQSPCAPIALGVSSQYPAWRCSGRDGRTGLTATKKTVPAGLTSRRSPV
jgi:hypothetical protein